MPCPSRTGTYTLLAPPDSAITSKGYTWPRLLMDRAKGRDLMRRHTIPGALYTEGLLQRRTVRTLAGTSVTFRRDMDGRNAAEELVALGLLLRFLLLVIMTQNVS